MARDDRPHVAHQTWLERRFVDAFLGSCAGNGTEAAIVSGYTRTRNRPASALPLEGKKPTIKDWQAALQWPAPTICP